MFYKSEPWVPGVMYEEVEEFHNNCGDFDDAKDVPKNQWDLWSTSCPAKREYWNGRMVIKDTKKGVSVVILDAMQKNKTI